MTKGLLREIAIVGMVVFLSATILFAQGPDTLWTRTYGGVEWDLGYSVQTTTDKAYVVVGKTQSFGAGDCDVYILKIDADGDTIWSKTYGGSNLDSGYSIQETSDGGYVVAGKTHSFGAAGGAVYLIRTDRDGDSLWTKTYGGMWDAGYAVRQTFDGGYIIVGGTYSSNIDDQDVYLVKTDANGNVLWTRTFGGTDGDVGLDVRQASDSGYAIVGDTRSFGTGLADIYLIRTNAEGETLWTRTYGERDYWDHGRSVLQTSDGGFVVTGLAIPLPWGLHAKILCLKTDVNGNLLWLRSYHEDWSVDYFAFSIEETLEGKYVIAGSSAGAGPCDVYLMKIDTDGEMMWERKFGGSGSDEGRSIKRTSDGGYVMVGYTNSFGAGGYDVYLARIAPETGVEHEESLQQDSFGLQTGSHLLDDWMSVQYEVPEKANVRINIYSPLGHKVRTLLNEHQPAGLHRVIWDATDNSGRKVPSGTYFLRLETGQHTATRKLCVVR